MKLRTTQTEDVSFMKAIEEDSEEVAEGSNETEEDSEDEGSEDGRW